MDVGRAAGPTETSVDVVVLVYKEHSAQLSSSLQAIAQGCTPAPSRVVLAINPGSSATALSARSLVKTFFPASEHVVITFSSNVGFGRAVNLAISECVSAHVVVLNPDGVMSAGGLEALLSVARNEPRALLCSADIVDLDDVRETGAVAAKRVERLPGGAGVFNRKLFISLGGFDPMYFLYAEDWELCLRAQLAGQNELHHVEGAFFRHPASHRRAKGARFSSDRLASCYEAVFTLQYAPNAREGVRRILRMRRGRLGALVKIGDYRTCVAVVLGTLQCLTHIGRIRARRRRPWSEDQLQGWLSEIQLLADVERQASEEALPAAAPAGQVEL